MLTHIVKLDPNNLAEHLELADVAACSRLTKSSHAGFLAGGATCPGSR